VSVLKRLESVERAIGFHHPRTIVMSVPMLLVSKGDNSGENDAGITAEVQKDIDEILRDIGATDEDLIVQVASFMSNRKRMVRVSRHRCPRSPTDIRTPISLGDTAAVKGEGRRPKPTLAISYSAPRTRVQ
jgi:hypothetical protein